MLRYTSRKNFFSENNIQLIIFSSSIILITLLSFLFSVIFIFNKNKNLDKEYANIEMALMAQQKEFLRSTVVLQQQRIDYCREQVEKRLQQTLQQRVIEAHTIALNLYNSNKYTKSKSEVALLIRDVLSPIRFNDGQGYYFIYSMEGLTQLNPPEKEKEGKNAREIYSGKRLEAIEELKKVVQQKGEGFLTYNWLKPGAGEDLFKKISYVTYFEPFDWFIGSGEYYDTFEEKVKDEIVQEINDSLPPGNEDCFFVYHLHDIQGGDEFATMLANPNRKEFIGQKISDSYTDSFGYMFRKEFMQGIRDKGEAFATYWKTKSYGEKPCRKMSYFSLYPEWNWIIARGIYLDVFDEILARKKGDVLEKTKKEQLLLITLFCLSIAFVVLIAHYFTKGITNILEEYKRTQKKQQADLARMNEVLEKKATTDTLTGLYNRQFFNTQLKDELTRYKRYTSPFCLVIFDVDDFKTINDTLGHVSGDHVLEELASLVSFEKRQTDILARWGGEEFVILVVENKREAALQFAEKLRHKIENHPFSIDRTVTCSFGVAEYRLDEEERDFIIRADKALYLAKNRGKNRVYGL